MLNTIAQVGSEPPIQAVLMEGIVLLVFTYLSLKTGLKYLQGRVPAVRNLFLSFSSYFFAGLALFTTKAIEHFTQGGIDVSSLGINLGYAFSALGNLFLFYFTLDIFFTEIKPYFRETITIATGITEGFLFIFIFKTQTPFIEIPGIYIPFQLLFWHVTVSSLIFIILFSRSFTEMRKTTNPVPRAGFLMIALSALFELFVFIFFIIDSLFPAGYSLFYFLGWTSASLAGFCAMIGYLMPDWFKNMVQKRAKS